jgi:hypothetical protein
VAEGEGEAEVSLFFLVVSFFVVVALSFLEASDEDFLVEDFFVVVEVFAEDFSGAVVVVDVSVLLVQAAMSPAANMTVME